MQTVDASLHASLKRLLTAALFIFTTTLGCLGMQNGSTISTVNGKESPMMLIGHRGAAGLFPENTLTAFEKALSYRVGALETDVQITADGNVVLYHDLLLKPEITRTAEGKWLADKDRKPIKALTLSELKTYDVGRLKPFTVYARRFPDQKPADGQRIPTLRELIDLLKNRRDTHTGLWLEIKTSPEKPALSSLPESVVDATVSLLKREGFLERTRILSFDWRALVYCLKHYPEIPVVFLSHSGATLDNLQSGHPGPSPWMAGVDIDDFAGSVPRAIRHLGGKHWGPQFRSLNADRIYEAHGIGVTIYAWTVDDQSDMDRLMHLGVDGIITNRPDVLRSLLQRP